MPAKVTYASCCDSSGNALDAFYMLLIKKIHNNIIKTRKRYVQTRDAIYNGTGNSAHYRLAYADFRTGAWTVAPCGGE